MLTINLSLKWMTKAKKKKIMHIYKYIHIHINIHTYIHIQAAVTLGQFQNQNCLQMWIFISSYLQSFINHSPNSPKMFFLLFRPKIKFDLLIGLQECSELSSNSQMRREDPFSVTKPTIVCVLDINFFSSVFTQKSRNDQQLSYRHTISSESYSVQLLS